MGEKMTLSNTLTTRGRLGLVGEIDELYNISNITK